MDQPVNRTIIRSWEELQANVVPILSRLNAEPSLQLAAMSNPILALRELGYDIDPSVRDEVEERLRFKTKTRAMLNDLRSQIFSLAGKSFDLRSEDDIDMLLFGHLQLQAYDERGCPLPAHIRQRSKQSDTDDLQQYKDVHPIIEPMLRFRELDTSVPAFSDRFVYAQLRAGERTANSLHHIRFKLKSENN